MEHHIPASFSPERPAVGFDHVDLSSMSVADHQAAAHIPHPPRDGRPAVVGDPDKLNEFIHGPNVPTKADDYLYSDRPELGLRIVSFNDKTIVVLHWIHLAFDATAKRSLLDAWSLMLQGREDEIPEPLSPHDYILEDCGKAPTERHVLADHHVSKPGLVWWALQNAYNVRPQDQPPPPCWPLSLTGSIKLAFRAKEHRMVCIPADYLAKLRGKAIAELAAEAPPGSEQPFLSEGDIIVAWTSRLAIANLDDPDRTVRTP